MKKYLALIMIAIAPLASAQALKLSVFEKLKERASDSTDMNLSKDLMSIATGFIRGDSGDAGKIKKLVEGLNSILIRSLEFEKDGAYGPAEIQELIAELGGPGWNLTISADEKHGKNHEISRVWTKAAPDGGIAGLRILSAESRELSVIEIVGKVRLEDLKDLQGLGVPDLGLGKKNDE